MLKIYGQAGSINVRKVLWVCEELNLSYDREDWGGTYRPLSDPHFKALNSAGMIPVIDDDGVVVWESNTIVRYLAASRSRTDLLPTQPAARAHVEQWMDWQGGDLNNVVMAVANAEVTLQTAVALVGREQLVELVARQRLAGERVDHDLALRHLQLDQEVARERDAARGQPDLQGQLAAMPVDIDEELRYLKNTIREKARHAEPEVRGGPGCLNRFSASISGASVGVRLPSGVAAE